MSQIKDWAHMRVKYVIKDFKTLQVYIYFVLIFILYKRQYPFTLSISQSLADSSRSRHRRNQGEPLNGLEGNLVRDLPLDPRRSLRKGFDKYNRIRDPEP